MISPAMDLMSSIFSLQFACALPLSTFCVPLRLMLPTSAALLDPCAPCAAFETSPPEMIFPLQQRRVKLR
jgi:hypothetical protein